jgi:AcrR family transcriptional regulator
MTRKSRKEEYAETTRTALLDAALDQFIQKGYAKTSIEDIVIQARVTRGALYHHFSSKEEMFVLVYEKLAKKLVAVIQNAIKDKTDPWDRAIGACLVFLDYCVDPKFRSIRLNDAIGVMGFDQWRKIDSSYTMGLLKSLLQELTDSKRIAIQTSDYLANLIYSLLVESALTIASAKDKKAARDELAALIKKILIGLKAEK